MAATGLNFFELAAQGMKKQEEIERLAKIQPNSSEVKTVDRMRQSLTRMLNSVIGKAEKSLIELSMLLMRHPQRYTTAKFEYLVTGPFIRLLDFEMEERVKR